jgi:hypothetical protein
MSSSTSLTQAPADFGRFRHFPRFGYPTSFPDLFSDDQAVAMQYLTGVLVVGLVILILFCCWFVALLLCKRCAKRSGFLSGAPFKAAQEDGNKNPWILRGRIIFAMSCALCIVFAIVLATAGIGNLETTTTTIGDGAEVRIGQSQVFALFPVVFLTFFS